MSTTNPVTGASIGQAASQASSAVPANMQINETDFLQLITSQLKDQDPMSPADPTQFLSQLEGLSEVSSLQSMQTAMATSQMTSGAALLGQSVLAPGSTATLSSGGTINGAVNAPPGTTGLMVTISDSTGAPVTSFQVTPQPSGLTGFSWNGATSAGTTAAAGQYQISVNATVNGATQAVPPNVVSQVQSVTIDPTSQGLELNTTNGAVPLSSVVTVY